LGNDKLRFSIDMTTKTGEIRVLLRYDELGFNLDMRIERWGGRLELDLGTRCFRV